MAVIHRFEKGGALSAVGGAVRGIFNVAALIDRAVGTQQGGADVEAGIGRIGMTHGLLGQSDQLFRLHCPSSLRISWAKLTPGVSSSTSSSCATVAAMSAKLFRVPMFTGRTF